jgi:hypothetical protein
MPGNVEEAMEKARALETTFSIGMELSTYLILPGYLQNMNGGIVPAKTNMDIFQSAYTTTFKNKKVWKKWYNEKSVRELLLH